jgi:DNA helicase II / ATP-dependent DNA helicase PcrA
MPSDLGAGTSAEIEEQGRLLYVAMTRAKDDLHLVVPQRFFVHGRHAQGDRRLYASRTRFIPEKLLGLFERITWPVVPAGTAARPASQGPKVDIGARMPQEIFHLLSRTVIGCQSRATCQAISLLRCN